MAELTIAFVDLTGSVSVFETLGNDRATMVVTKLTQWIGATGMEHGEAQDFIDGYFRQFPQVKGWIDAAIAQAHKDGFATYQSGFAVPDHAG